MNECENDSGRGACPERKKKKKGTLVSKHVLILVIFPWLTGQ
jgi:hypothetical protein